MDIDTTRSTLAPMYDRLGGDGADGAPKLSPLHRMGVLLLAFLSVVAMPTFWASTALGDESDEPTAPLAGKSGSGEEDEDESGDDDENSTDGNSTDGNGRSDGAGDTQGTDGAGDTQGTIGTDRGAATASASATDGVNDTRGTDGAGDTQGTVNTDKGEETARG